MPNEAFDRSSHWWTWANGLTALRLLAAPVCMSAIASGFDGLAAGLFALAVFTDYADGQIARRLKQSSALGGLFDHASDAVFVAAGLAGLAYVGVVPVFLPILVLLSFIQYAFDSRALAGHRLIPSSLGRWNGIAYFVALGVPVIRDVLGWSWPTATLVSGFGWLLVASTLFSMAGRARRVRDSSAV